MRTWWPHKVQLTSDLYSCGRSTIIHRIQHKRNTTYIYGSLKAAPNHSNCTRNRWWLSQNFCKTTQNHLQRRTLPELDKNRITEIVSENPFKSNWITMQLRARQWLQESEISMFYYANVEWTFCGCAAAESNKKITRETRASAFDTDLSLVWIYIYSFWWMAEWRTHDGHKCFFCVVFEIPIRFCIRRVWLGGFLWVWTCLDII